MKQNLIKSFAHSKVLSTILKKIVNPKSLKDEDVRNDWEGLIPNPKNDASAWDIPADNKYCKRQGKQLSQKHLCKNRL